MKVHLVSSLWCNEAQPVEVCASQARADRFVAEWVPRFSGETCYTDEMVLNTEGLLVQHVVMRHLHAPEVHTYERSEEAAQTSAKHFRDAERKGAYYYAAVIVPLEPVQ